MPKKQTLPPQSQDQQPGLQTEMDPKPISIEDQYRGSQKLKGKVALITGGDSGIGRAVAYHFAREGADCAIVYLNEDQDAEKTKKQVEAEGRRCLLIRGDVGDSHFCQDAVEQTVNSLGGLHILVNNAAEQHPQSSLTDITDEQLEQTFRTNIFSFFYLTRSALPHLNKGACIINTTSVTAYRGSPELLDYSTTKGAIVSFTRSLAMSLVDKEIRVNGVAPGPIWTPLIPATFTEEKVSQFGGNVPMKRPGQPEEVAPAFVFLASDDSSYMTGQVLHVNGGDFIST